MLRWQTAREKLCREESRHDVQQGLVDMKGHGKLRSRQTSLAESDEECFLPPFEKRKGWGSIASWKEKWRESNSSRAGFANSQTSRSTLSGCDLRSDAQE